MSLDRLQRSFAACALAVLGAAAPAQSLNTVEDNGPFGLVPAVGYVDGYHLRIGAPSGTWVLPLVRPTLQYDAVQSLFTAEGILHTDQLLAFVYQPEIFPLLAPGTVIPAGNLPGIGPVPQYTVPGAAGPPGERWNGETVMGALHAMLLALGYPGTYPEFATNSDAEVLLPIHPVAVATYLASALLPVAGSSAQDNVRWFQQLSLPFGPANEANGTTMWQSSGYQSWDSSLTPAAYRTYWENVLANQTDDAATSTNNTDMVNQFVISREKWVAQTLKAAMGREDAVSFVLTSLRAKLIDAFGAQAPSVVELPIWACYVPCGIEDYAANAAYAAANSGNFPTSPLLSPGIVAAITDPNGTPPPPKPRIRFGNPICFGISLRALVSAGGSRNGVNFNAEAAGGKLKVSLSGAGLAPATATVLSSGVTYQIALLPDARPGMYVGDLPAAITPGAVVRVSSISSAFSSVTGSGGALYLLTAQP